MKKTAFILAGMALPMTGHSAIITQTVSNLDWNEAIWGSPAAAPSAGNDYVSATGGNDLFRIGADGGSTTFGGDSIEVVAGTRALSKMQLTSTATINGSMTLSGGWLDFAPNSSSALANTTISLTSLFVTAASEISVGSFTEVSTIAGTLTGSGGITFSLDNAARAEAQFVHFDAISGYSGALLVTENVGISFGSDYSFENTLTLQDADSFLVVNSGQTLTFDEGELIDSNGVVAPGSYSGGALDALGANYLNNGGTVLVVPEPSIALLGGLGFLGLLRRRRAA